MKKGIRYGVLALILYVIFLLVLLPADRVYAVLKEKIALPVSLYQVKGSLWNGSAAVALISNQRLESVDWRLMPWAMFIGHLQIALAFDSNGGRVDAVMGRTLVGNYFMHDINVMLPASAIEPVVEPLIKPLKLGLSGDVTANLQELAIKGNHLTTVNGRITWKDAGLSTSAAGSVGSFEINFETTADGVKGVLKDIEGPLQANGVIMLRPDGSYQFTASFTPRDARRNDIKQGLRFIGNPDPAGKVTTSQTGKLQLEKYLPFIAAS